jgi:drug/metabolite transporter (DMT)-like permease
MDPKRKKSSYTHERQSFLKEGDNGEKEIVEEDVISEIGQISLLSSSKYSLRRHTMLLDNSTSTYFGKEIPEEDAKKDDTEKDAVESKKRSKFEGLRHMRGFFFIIGYGLFFSLSAIFIKRAYLLAGSDNSVIRYALQLGIMFIITHFKKINCFGPKPQRVLLSLRGFIGQMSILCFHFSITLIDPSDTIAITNSSFIIASVLAWIFLKERFTISHVFALILTISGILLITQPKFLFGKSKSLLAKELNISNCSLELVYPNISQIEDARFIIEKLELKRDSTEFNKTSFNNKKCVLSLINANYKILNETYDLYENHTIEFELEHAPVIKKTSYLFYIGVLLALVYSFGSGATQILIKKLCMSKVHFAVATIYASYFGLPSSILISVILFATGVSHKHFVKELHFHLLPAQILFSVLSALCGIASQICLNFALNYEDASKVSILKTNDLLFAFVLQFFVLNIKPNLLSSIGALLILTGSFSIIAYKIIENNSKSRKNKAKQAENNAK